MISSGHCSTRRNSCSITELRPAKPSSMPAHGTHRTRGRIDRSSVYSVCSVGQLRMWLGLVSCSVGFAAGVETQKVTYEDHVLPIFRDNCLKCHNPDKLKGDLDLTSFSSAVKGGGGGATLNAG